MKSILKKSGLTFQKGKGIYPEAEDREEKVNTLKKTPGVAEANAVIVFQDEASLSNTATVSYMWAEKGKRLLKKAIALSDQPAFNGLLVSLARDDFETELAEL